MNTALAYLISAGIIAFGLWVIVGALSAAAYGWALIGFLPVIVGSFSIYLTSLFDIGPTAKAEQ